MTEPTKPAPKPVKSPAKAKATQKPHPAHKAAVPAPAAPTPASIPAKGLLVGGAAVALITSAVMGLIRRGR